MDVILTMKKKYKRGISFLLILALLLSIVSVSPEYKKTAKAAGNVWNGYVATSFEAGTGTKDNPYQIKWGSQLAYLAKTVSEGKTYEGKYFVVTADIQMNETDRSGNEWTTWTKDTAGLNEWNAIGTYESAENNKPFAGIFNGEGHTISGLWSCTRSTNGLFGYSTGSISNINITKSYIEGSGYGVGAIVGRNNGVIYGCTANASIVSKWVDDNNIEAGSAGGVTGTNLGVVNYVMNHGPVNGVGVTGGVVGTNIGKVLNSSNDGTVGEFEKSQYGTGGVVGCNSSEDAMIVNSYNNGNVYAENYAGGIVGTNIGMVINVYNNADVDIRQSEGMAGTIAGALEKAGFQGAGSVDYAYWDNDVQIISNYMPVGTVNAVGYKGSAGSISEDCLRYNTARALINEGGDITEVSFNVSGSPANTNNLETALDTWTQADNCGKASGEYHRWKYEDDKVSLCEISSAVWNGDASNSFGGGDGSKNSPYRITNGEQLKHLAIQVNSGNTYAGDYFVLASDVNLNDETFSYNQDTGLICVTDGDNIAYLGTGTNGNNTMANAQFDTVASVYGKWYEYDEDSSTYVEGAYAGILNSWIPIGTATKPFAGIFLGKGYSVHGVYVNNYACEGLFGYVDGGSFSNLGVEDSCLMSSASGYIGAISGYFAGDMTKCHVKNTVVCGAETDYTGGVAGYFADSSVSADGSYNGTGRLFGTTFEGTVCGSGKTGGICGYAGFGNTIDECSVSKESFIRGKGDAIGGIVGKNYGTKIVNTSNEAAVKSDVDTSYIGGIVGENFSNGASCIVGYPDVFSEVLNCYNRGKVTGGVTSYTGGIVGYNVGGTISNTYCDVAVSGITGGTVGGVVGVNGLSEGESTLYEGLTQQKYKVCNGTVTYSYSVAPISGGNLCDESSGVVYISNCSKFTTPNYNLTTAVLSSSTVHAAMNAWIRSSLPGLGNDAGFKKYLTWSFTSGSYPKFTGTNYTEVTDTEPLPKYSIIYNANGAEATGTMEPEVYEMTLPGTADENKPVIAENGFTREGYNFVGWNTSPDNSGETYMPGDRIDIVDTINLYAIWISTQAVITGTSIDGGNNVMINWSSVDDADGYWVYRVKSDGTAFTEFTEADKIAEVDKDTCTYRDENLEAGVYYYGIRAYSKANTGITATYVFKPFSEPAEVNIELARITYMKNFESDTSYSIQDCIAGKEAELNDCTFTNNGYVFAEWNSKADGTGIGYAAGDSVVFDEDVTLYAIWKMAPVKSLKAEITTNGTVLLTWEKSVLSDITGYRIYCSVGNNANYTLIGNVDRGNAATVRYQTEAITPSTEYYYRVTIYRDSQIATGTLSEESEYSNEISIMSEAELKLDDTKGTLENGKYTGINGNKVYIKWDAQPGVTGYEVYRSTKESEYGTKVGTVPSSERTFMDEVPYEGTFYYHMRSYKETKGSNGQIVNIAYGDYSKTFTVIIQPVVIEFNSNVKLGAQKREQVVGKNFEITLNKNMFTNSGFTFSGWNTKPDSTGEKYTDGQSCSFSENIVLYAIWKIDIPVNFSAQILENTLSLSWDNNTSADGYQIYQKVDNGDYELLDTVVPGSNTYNRYILSEYDNTRTYSFFLKSFVNEVLDSGMHATSYSDMSEIVTVAPTDAPDDQVTGVVCEVNPDGDNGAEVKISWRKVNDVTGYYIYRSRTATDYGERIGQTYDTSYNDLTVPVGSPGDYYYTVRAYVEDANGVYYRVPSIPEGVTFDKVKISYKPNGAEGQLIEKYYIKGAKDVEVEECIFVNPSYQFYEWYSLSEDAEQVYKPGETFEIEKLSGNISLVARWKLCPVEISEAKVNEDASISLTWTSNDMATGYNIYQKKGSNGAYSLLTQTPFTTFTTEAMSDVASTYFYYVVPYVETEVTSGKLQTEGFASEEISIIPDPEQAIAGKVNGVSAMIEQADVVLTWDTVENISGYHIYRSDVKGERGTCIATIDSQKVFTYTDSSATEIKTYYYTIRAFVEKPEATYYKPWSEVVDVTFEESVVKYVANDGTETETVLDVITGFEIEIPENEFVYPGRCFVSWNTNPLGKGFAYNPGDTLKITEDTTLYAIWKVEKPLNVKVEESEKDGSIVVVWDEVEGADGYVICRKDVRSDEIVERGMSVDSTTYIDYNDGIKLGPDDGYYYFVRAYETIDDDTRRFGDYSDTTEFSVIGDAIVLDKDPVGTVTNLSIVNIFKDNNTVRIGWSGVPAADGYRVYYKEGEDGERIYTGVDTIASNIITTPLKLDTKYYYYVVAYILDSATDSILLGEFSEALEVMVTSTPTPTEKPVDPSPTPNPHGKVENLKSKVVSGSAIVLSWDEDSKVDAYRVYKYDNKNGENAVKVGNDISGSSLTIKDIEKGKKYYYGVRGHINVQTDRGTVLEFTDWSDIIEVLIPTPTPTPTKKPLPTPTATQVPTASPEPTPSATPDVSMPPDNPVKDAKFDSFLITDAKDRFINLAWSPIEGAVEYEISIATSVDGEKMVINRIAAPETTCKDIEIADAIFNVRENINVTDIQAYGQKRDAEYYYFVRAVAEDVYSSYSEPVRVALHTKQLIPQVTPTPVPTVVPTVPPVTDIYKVGMKKTVGKLVYRITSKSSSGYTVEVVKPVKKSYKSVTIPATIKIAGKTYKVTSIKASAFAKNSKLKSIVIGKNIKKVKAKAFYKCTKLMKITIKSKIINTFGKKAFHGIKMKCRFIIPKKILTKYKKKIRNTEG